MSLALGKITVLLGAGILGSVLAQEGRISKVSDFFSGAFKIVFKHIQKDDAPSTSKPRDDSLLAQVNSLQQELQLLASSRSVTIVTGSSSGTITYSMPVVVVVGVVGYGYIWWKGWKFSDMMFATRRSLSDACTTVAKQLEQVHLSISATKRTLSSRIDRVDNNLDECAVLNAATKDEVVQLRGDLQGFGIDVEEVHRQVQDLETKIGRIEGKQDLTNIGVRQLVDFAYKLEQSGKAESTQASLSSYSKPAIESPLPPPRIASASRTLSMPPSVQLLEPSSPVASETPRVSRVLQTAVSASGLKEVQGISSPIKGTDFDSNGTRFAKEPVASGSSSGSSNSSSSGLFGWNISGLGTSFLTRTHSATSNFK
ncbi:uncharacterized protein LOC143847308 [Tasmannia lanceolata]|uniref:uncharacterized protein LOC143847308 n=1 Tax=Tasmannia lanceolata TaxID=3420 RepID=UPI004064042D